jgi:hypothetical protein
VHGNLKTSKHNRGHHPMNKQTHKQTRYGCPGKSPNRVFCPELANHIFRHKRRATWSKTAAGMEFPPRLRSCQTDREG